MAEIFGVPIRGIGKPDYSKEIALGRSRPGLTLKYGQTIKIAGVTASGIASLYPWVGPVIAAGASRHFINWETGYPMPYIIQKGYSLTIFQCTASFTEDAMVLIYFDGQFVAHFGTIASGGVLTRQDILGFSSTLFPDTGSPHLVDVQLENRGGGNLEGSTTILAIEEAIGTEPPPATKTVKCKFCGYEWVVSRETTAIKCPKCGQLNIYCDFSKFRGIG